ncbi:protein amnionless-like [Mizuhopecten yessoensis]|uniref:Protein amnionless n=1 Tax=Mizuhopecten yessoensis TaxID=6573 RepID=A0A210PQB1_MIZYE|nr:protein amnionless-like [Mizuhopecten yessoensis]OWF38673.1 Protein amnionless [Mizuhopecten yessoensis]
MELLRVTSVFFLIFIGNSPAKCLYKVWMSDANFGNPSNWDKGRQPCGDDIVVIHEESPAIYVQVNTTLQQIILPKNGEMILGSGSTLAFTNEPDHSAGCLSSGSEIVYNLTYALDWLDYANWCPSDTETGSCKSLALLDSEQTPCKTDDVVFPKMSSYFVNLESGLSLSVNTLKITGSAYTTTGFSQFLNTTDGKRMFPISPSTGSRSSVQIARRRCTDPTGCACGNDGLDILRRICKYRSPYCTRIRCKQPIRPSGSCCEICGAVLSVQYGTGFKFADLRDGLQRSFLDDNDNYKDVQYIVSKMSDGHVQIVLSDVSGDQSVQAGREMKADLDNDNAGGFKYAIRSVSMETSRGSGLNPTHGPQTGRGLAMSRGEIAGIVVGLVTVLLISLFLGTLFYRRKTRGPEDISFKMFDRISFKPSFPKPRLEVPPSFSFRFGGSSSVPETVGARSQGFDNPMYGTNPLSNDKPLDLEMMPTLLQLPEVEEQPSYDNGLGFDNPLYENVESTQFSDPTDGDIKMDVDESLGTDLGSQLNL